MSDKPIVASYKEPELKDCPICGQYCRFKLCRSSAAPGLHLYIRCDKCGLMTAGEHIQLGQDDTLSYLFLRMEQQAWEWNNRPVAEVEVGD